MFNRIRLLANQSNRWVATVLLIAIASSGISMPAAFGDRLDAPELRQVAVPIELVDPIATRLSLRYHSEVGVSITADDRGGGAILVMAPPSLQDKIADDAAKLTKHLQSTVLEAGERTTVKIQLQHISWREAEDLLRAIAGGNVPVTTSRSGERATFQIRLGKATAPTQVDVDRRIDSVTLTAAQRSQTVWQRVFTAIDQPVRFNDEQTEVLRLVHAEVGPVQRAIRLLEALDRKATPEQEQQLNRPAGMRNQANFRTAAFMQNAGDSDEVVEEEIPTPSADVAAAVADAAAEDAEGGVIGDTDIQIVPDSGLIIIKGAKRDVERIKQVIAEIEAQAKITQPQIEVRELEYADSNAVAALLQQLYEDVLSARQGDVSITSLDAPNALLLIGRAEAIKAVMDLVDKIDQPIPDTDKLRVFRLKHASALDVETSIREFFTNQPGEDSDQRPGLGVRVRVRADQRTNSLVVAASPRDLAEVTRLVDELDVSQAAATSQIRIFPLRNARAEDLAVVLQDAVTAEPENVPEGTTPKTSTLSMVALGQAGNSVLNSGVLSGTVVTADNNSNAIVVRAPSEGMQLIAELIRQLDQPAGVDSLVKVFTVENGDATQLTTALQNLFGTDAGTAGTSVGAGNQAGLTSLSAGDSALVGLRFSTDARTNSIIASGSAEDLEVVESILLRLDSTGFAERITEVIWLKHQIAENIATAITSYVTARQQSQNIIPQLQQNTGPYDLPDRDLIVVPENQTNSLLLSVSPRLYEEVRQLIDRLDRRPPMVLIKTLIAEVRLSDGFEIGGEVGLQDSLLFDRGIAANTAGTGPNSIPGFNFNNNGLPNRNSAGRDTLASQGVTSFGLATSQLMNAGSAQGFAFSAASDSISLFLRTLQLANRLQVLSRPQVMTVDNTTGFINVGQSFPRPTEVVATQFNTQIGIEDIDVGITLQVTPRVGADGLIIMDIDASRKNVNFTTGQVIGTTSAGADIFVPAIDQSVARSTITAFDGQTVVFGGLIQKVRSNTTRRVPYLSSIPLLGVFFRYDSEQEERNELLVIMTPTLVTGDEDLEYVKVEESNRMSWCLADVVEAHGNEGLSGGHGLWGPAIGPTIFPDIQPTVDVFPAADMPTNSAGRTVPPIYPNHMIHGGMIPSDAEMRHDGELPQGSGLPPGVELAPGESIMTPAELFQSDAFGNSQVPGQSQQWVPEVDEIPQVPNSTPEMVYPNTNRPDATPKSTAPQSDGRSSEPRIFSPSDGASTTGQRTSATPASVRTSPTKLPDATPTTSTPPRRWSSFQGKLGNWIGPSKAKPE
ncbi:secretin N-terminal domain-containing protein [Allorhodopirellula heiligendammensis]|uniref:Type II secretion system protein D n=1 Tax=Allorhodopirellula heiligendammensis TaxID=2714739 RepID=A0A5C6C1Q1_9BACT|nr:secretin N-terminal domain-containing protein [Allorhodopirellula heiligendammensis]TWU18470.1 Type II secretion system protein D precursor [Allorhodopirellula heiligendammensis]